MNSKDANFTSGQRGVGGDTTIPRSSTRTSTPFTSLFLSSTRALPSSSSAPPPCSYAILFQHTHKLPLRMAAAEPLPQSQSSDKHVQHINPKERSGKDIHGGVLFIQKAWEECVKRCDGKVVLVKCLDGHCNFRDETDTAKKEYWSMFEKNGVIVDLYSDPLNWDDDDDDDDGGADAELSMKKIKGCTSKLQSISFAIDEALRYIHKRKHTGNFSGTREGGSTGIYMNVNTADDQTRNLQSPIPVIFDSISPILMHQGIEKFTIFLTQLKQKSRSTVATTISARETAQNKDGTLPPTSMQEAKPIPMPIPSPIFLPYLIETLPLSSHLILEEYADALMTLQNGQLFIAKRSARVGGMICGGLSGGTRLTKNIQLFDIDSDNQLKLLTENSIRKGCGKGRDDQARESKEEGSSDTNETSVESISTGTDLLTVDSMRGYVDTFSNKQKKNEALSQQSRTQQRHQRPILEHQLDEQTRQLQLSSLSSSAAPSHQQRPRIYLEENDPEFDDFDEEDPDDDLDI